MADLEAVSSKGDKMVIPAADVEQFKASLRGGTELPGDDAHRAMLRGGALMPGEDGYDDARSIFNAMIDRRPSIVVRCAGAADVMASIKFARKHNLLLSVRGGAHNVGGFAVCDGGMMLDLSHMNAVSVDPKARTARVGPGCTWYDVNHELAAFGLAASGGFVSATGVSGLTLGGGLGWLARKHGLACDNLKSVDIVTSEGKLLTANASENADLFWAIRGGGGNFGVVTSFEFSVYPVAVVTAGLVLHPLSKVKEAVQHWRDVAVPKAPDELTDGIMLMSAPPAPFLAPEVHGTPVGGVFGVHCGPTSQAEQDLKGIREFGPPIADIYQPMPYLAAQTMIDFLFPRGNQHYWKSCYLKELSDAAIDTMLAHFARVPSKMTAVFIDHGDGAIRQPRGGDTSFGFRDWTFSLLTISTWATGSEAEANTTWTREFHSAMQPFATERAYVNYLSDEGEAGVTASYEPSVYRRLAQLKKRYDPSNVFRMNQNIKPAG